MAISCWPRLSTLTENRCALCTNPSVRVPWASETSTSGGSSETEMNELSVMPPQRPSCSTMMTVTPVANSPTAPRNASLGTTVLMRSEAMGVLRELPVGDPGAEALQLRALDHAERIHQRRAERVVNHRVGLECLEGLLERGRQSQALRVLWQLVDHSLDRRRRLELAADAVEAARERRRVCEVRVRGAVADAYLQPGRRPAFLRHAHQCHAVVVAPAAARRDERLRADAPVGVHRRVEEDHHRRRVLEHACDEVTGDRCQTLVG